MLQMYFQKGMQSLFFMATALSLLSFIMVCWPNSKADCLWGRQRKRKHLLKKQRGTEMEMFKKKKKGPLGHLKCLFGMLDMFFCAKTPSGNKPDEACDLSWPPSFLWDVKVISKQSGRVQADSFSAEFFFEVTATALSKAEFNTWLMGCLATVWPCHSASWQDTFTPISYCIVKLTSVFKCVMHSHDTSSILIQSWQSC